MANVQIAIDFVLRQEDADLTGKVTTIPGDLGGPTRFGIASTFHPDLVARGFFDPAKVPFAEALVMAQETYEREYADPLWIGKMIDQGLATAVLSFGINTGVVRPIRFLQQAVNQQGHPIAIDGAMGNVTLGYVNSIGPDIMLNGFALLANRYYQALAQQTPADQVVLHGWLNRVDAWLQYAPALRKAAGQS